MKLQCGKHTQACICKHPHTLTYSQKETSTHALTPTHIDNSHIPIHAQAQSN